MSGNNPAYSRYAANSAALAMLAGATGNCTETDNHKVCPPLPNNDNDLLIRLGCS